LSNPDIKIFVSHRIDLDTPLIKDNPLYRPMRCGAVYDSRKNALVPGDDTGDNISNKKPSYSEFTVQYWAWKNNDADYYGMCHYRRYLSFSDTKYKKEDFGRHVAEEVLDASTFSKYGFTDVDNMVQVIASHDLVIPEAAKIYGVSPLNGYLTNNMYRHWSLFFGALVGKPPGYREERPLEIMLGVLKERYPEYYEDALDYLSYDQHIGFNCFVMKRDLFHRMCALQFDVMHVVEDSFDILSYEKATQNAKRVPAYIGELLFGIYVHHLQRSGCYSIKPLQLVLFEDAGTPVDQQSDTLLGTESKLRRTVKKIANSVLPAYRTSLRTAQMVQQLSDSVAEQKQALARPLNYYDSIRVACTANDIQKTHAESFQEYKACNAGKDVVILAAGSTLDYYEPIHDAVHIGMNSTYKFNRVKLDFYFFQDWEYEPEYPLEVTNSDFVKFFGKYLHPATAERHQVPEGIATAANARRYYSSFPANLLYPSIEYYPLADFASVVFPALHFALYTAPERIYLVGCDASSRGHWDGTEQHAEKGRALKTDVWVNGYIRMRKLAKWHYPQTEIISINPLYLKGLFTDVYTQSYRNAHPGFDEHSRIDALR
jgi:hypothetical protein